MVIWASASKTGVNIFTHIYFQNKSQFVFNIRFFQFENYADSYY